MLLAVLVEDGLTIGIAKDELLQPIFLELTPRAVLIGEAVALGIVSGEVEDESFAESLGELCLQVVLLVVVGIVSIASIGRATPRGVWRM